MIEASMYIFGEEPKPAKIEVPQVVANKAPVGKPTVTLQSSVDLSTIQAMFMSAHNKGLKAPKYRANGLILSMAPLTGKNPGAIYVKTEDTDLYLGKVTNYTFHPTRDCKDEHKAALILWKLQSSTAGLPHDALAAAGNLTIRLALQTVSARYARKNGSKEPLNKRTKCLKLGRNLKWKV